MILYLNVSGIVPPEYYAVKACSYTWLDFKATAVLGDYFIKIGADKEKK